MEEAVTLAMLLHAAHPALLEYKLRHKSHAAWFAGSLETEVDDTDMLL